jgi:hypothetical protein
MSGNEFYFVEDHDAAVRRLLSEINYGVMELTAAVRMLVPAQVQTPDDRGWIRHYGGMCPVGSDTQVDLEFRNLPPCFGATASRRRWFWNGSDDDVIHYRLAGPRRRDR